MSNLTTTILKLGGVAFASLGNISTLINLIIGLYLLFKASSDTIMVADEQKITV